VTIASSGEAREAARRIHAIGGSSVIITGGHGAGPEIVDLFFDGRAFVELRTPRIDSRSTHGTGCTFASALAACLALGMSPEAAATSAQQYVAGAIRHAVAIGRGYGPLNHFWQTRPLA
jgi:hydroxymethylpyrimidine/phosphomethylpyrimidine kinase